MLFCWFCHVLAHIYYIMYASSPHTLINFIFNPQNSVNLHESSWDIYVYTTSIIKCSVFVLKQASIKNIFTEFILYPHNVLCINYAHQIFLPESVLGTFIFYITPTIYRGLIARLLQVRWLFFPILNLLTMKAL